MWKESDAIVSAITLSVIIPTCNAAATIIPVVQSCLNTLPRHVADSEIIIVDDHSRDATPTIANNLAANYAPVMVLHHPHRRGCGAALSSGFQAARGDYLLILDASGLAPINEIGRLLSYTHSYDLIRGYRLYHQDVWYRHIIPNLQTGLFNRFFHLDLHDVACHFLLLQARVATRLLLKSHTMLVTAELYARANHMGLATIQVGVPGLSSNHPLQGSPCGPAGMWVWWDLLRLRTYLNVAKNPATER